MADQLNMNGLSIDDAHNGQNGFGGARSAYVPPHARSSQKTNGGLDGSSWGPNG